MPEFVKQYALHKPTQAAQNKLPEIRHEFSELHKLLVKNCPASRELSVALTHLQQACQMSIAAVVLNDPDSKVIDPMDELKAIAGI